MTWDWWGCRRGTRERTNGKQETELACLDRLFIPAQLLQRANEHIKRLHVVLVRRRERDAILCTATERSTRRDA
jgi:hypothetical protein